MNGILPLGPFKSIDKGENWTSVRSPEPLKFNDAAAFISDLTIDPSREGFIYSSTVAYMTPIFIPAGNEGIFKSMDGGDSWQAINNAGNRDLLQFPIYKVLVDPIIFNNLYAVAGFDGNWASVLVTWYQDSLSSLTINPHYDNTTSCGHRTPSDESIRSYIRLLHGKGLKVMLRPYVDLEDWCYHPEEHWRGNIYPSDIDSWFNSYKSIMLKYAQIAEEEKAEMLCIGGELAKLSGDSFGNKWAFIIADIRSVYSGSLTYSAAFPNDISGDSVAEYHNVSFLDLLDYVGISFYPMISEADVSNRSELKSSMLLFKNLIDIWRLSLGKKIIFTEVGFPSQKKCASTQWLLSKENKYNEECQENAFSAFFETFADTNYIEGAFIWEDILDHTCTDPCDGSPHPTNDDRYTLMDKKAESLMRFWYRVELHEE